MEFDVVKAILSKKEDFLRRHMVLSTSVIEKLRQYEVIGKYTMDQMMINIGNTDKQLTHLFVCLRTRGLPAFNGFLKVLRVTFHGWLADDLLDTTIETDHTLYKPVGGVIPLRDVINNMHQSKIGHSISAAEYLNWNDKFAEYTPKKQQNKQFDTASVVSSEEGNSPTGTEHGRDSPITRVPRNIRDLEKVFDNESVSTTNFLATLRQEEIRLRALLQQNLREQQDLLSKQDALVEIKDKMKEISKSATQLFRPEPDTRVKKPEAQSKKSLAWKPKKSRK
ncbi:hypothetical protein ACF0H5_020778 [Mactra antiquata]